VRAETARCLSCGASVVDPNKCIGCGLCTTKCGFDAIHLHRERPECSTMIKAEDKMKAILPYMVKRQFRIKRAGKGK
jgi:Fe-S-cluster-containing hydrogenase component 2